MESKLPLTVRIAEMFYRAIYTNSILGEKTKPLTDRVFMTPAVYKFIDTQLQQDLDFTDCFNKENGYIHQNLFGETKNCYEITNQSQLVHAAVLLVNNSPKQRYIAKRARR